MLGRFKALFRKVITSVFEGKTFTGLFKSFWHVLWKNIDIVIGFIPRIILKYSTKIDNNKIFFHSQENVYTCNPKYITEELLRRDLPIKIAWRGDNYFSSHVPSDVKIVKYNTYEYYKELYSARVIVTNSSLFVGFPVFLKKGQCLIETWHGSLGLKKWSKEDIKDSFKRVFALEQTGRMTDFCISNSTLEDGSMRATYWPETPIYRLGHARNDIFFEGKKELRKKLKSRIAGDYGFSPKKKIVMYAPTFRDRVNDLSYLAVDYESVIEALTERFKGDWIFFIRLHPSLRKRSKELNISNNNRIIDVTSYPDMQELAAICDVAITDYSSWIYDFVLTRKPGFIFATDIEEYEKEDRGFYYPITETPFAIAKNNRELIDNILSFDEKEYVKKVESFLEDKGCVDDGHASERAVDKILEVLDAPKKVVG